MMESINKKTKRWNARKIVIYFLTLCLVSNTGLPAVLAAPSGGAFTIGTGTIEYGANTAVTVDQAQSVIQWGSTGIGGIDTAAGESLTFLQAEGLSNSAVLNRIMSGNPTLFNGTLNGADMQIFIVNPAGIIFGGDSQVNVSQLVASSLDISNQNFLDGLYEFSDTGEYLGAIENYGAITANQGAALIGKRVLNAGTITTNPGGFVVMTAGDRVLLGEPGSKIVVEMDSVTVPEGAEGIGDVTNEGGIESPGGTIVLAAGDIFSVPLHPQLRVNSGTVEEPVYEVADQPVRVESGIGTVTQSGTINADGIDSDGGSVTLTAGDNVTLAEGSLTTANGGVSNEGAKGGEVIAYASEIYAPDDPGALVDFQAGAQIEVKGGAPSDPSVLAPADTVEKFDGGLAEISGNHLFFNGTVDATSTPFEVPDPITEGETIAIVPEGGELHVDPLNLTLADGPIPAEGAAIDTFYEKELEAYSQAGVDTVLEADYHIAVENITDGLIDGGSGDIALRTAYNNGSIEFQPATEGGPIDTIVQTTGGGNIFMLAGSGGIKTGRLRTYEDGGNPGRIRIFTNNGGDIETRSLLVDGGNNVEVSIIASGNLTIDGSNDNTNLAGVRTYTNKVPSEEDQTGTAYICLVSENGSVNIIGAVDVEAHGKEQTVAQIHICADNTVYVNPLNGRIQAVAKTSSAGTADARIRIHAGAEEPAITVEGGDSIRVQANTSGYSIGPLDFSAADFTEPNPEVYEEINGGSEVFVQIADAWLGICDDCPAPPDLLPPVEPPQHSPIAVDDDYVIDKGDTLVIILDADGVLGNDYDPDDDSIMVIVLDGRDTTEGGWVVLNEDGGFEYTPPTEKLFDEYGSDENGDYAVFSDTFMYQVEDEGGLNSDSATVTITAKNYIPLAQPDSYEVVHNVNLSPTAGEGVIVGVVPAINGDSDFDGDSLTPYLSGGLTTGLTAEGGEVTLNADGSFSYTPPADWVGTDSFTYYASDGYNNSTPVEVTIGVTNTPPVAQADSYDVIHNTELSPAADQGVIVGLVPAENGDTDADGDALTAVLVDGGSTLLGGNVTLNDDGSFTYTPPTDTVGTDSFTYYVTDSYSNSDPVQVTINLTNTLPVAQPDSYNVDFETSFSPEAGQGVITGLVPAINGDYDPDPGDSLTAYLSGGVSTGPTAEGGTVTLNPDGSFTYTPAGNWVGADSFTYYVTDSYGNSEPVVVTLHTGAPPFIPPTPGLEPVEIESSGCPALMAWAAAELGVDEGRLQIGIANSLASGMAIQPCDACAGLKQAATILQDSEGTHLEALAQVVNEFASSTAPPTEEQMASIADAMARNAGAENQYAAAGRYVDALAKYVGVLNDELGFSVEDAIQLVTDKYVNPLTDEAQNAGVAAYVAAQLAALAGS